MTKGRRSSTPDITDVTSSSKTGKRVRMCLFVLVLQQEKKWILKGSHYILVFTKSSAERWSLLHGHCSSTPENQQTISPPVFMKLKQNDTSLYSDVTLSNSPTSTHRGAELKVFPPSQVLPVF